MQWSEKYNICTSNSDIFLRNIGFNSRNKLAGHQHVIHQRKKVTVIYYIYKNNALSQHQEPAQQPEAAAESLVRTVSHQAIWNLCYEQSISTTALV